jgi:hypothetical protein
MINRSRTGILGPAGQLGRYSDEPCRRQIQPVDEGNDAADGILRTDILIQAL